MNDTICSIATTLGVGAISIIRVSGNEALKIVSKIFSKNLVDVSTHTIHYGYIKNKEEIIDEVLVSVMLKPKTYTMEDVVEINCHGGIETTNKVLELLLLNGCRLAEPGEFTKRAFLNGRIDLMQTDKARKISINGLRGNGSNLIKKLREDLINIISNIEVNIDYPEYEDIYEVTIKDIKEKVLTLKNSLTKIINEYEDAKIIQDGILTAIVGRPNVGKSSLLNRLLNEEKAIVTNIEGTTIDIVEGEILIDGIKINIIDTAGIRKTDDVVESIGVKKSLDIINKATLTLLLLDNSKELTKDDLELLEMTKDRTSIVVINKDDLESKLDLTKLKDRNIIYINTLSNDGIENLKNEIKKLFNLEKLDTSDYNYITNVRQIAKIKECLVNIEDIEKGLQENTPLDMLEIDLKTIWDTLGSIIGESYDEELLDNLFSKFCVGK